MALFKMVDGVNVQCSPEEEAAIRAEWAKDDADRPRRAKVIGLDDLVRVLIAKRVIDPTDLR
jgi:hypothetical protein